MDNPKRQRRGIQILMGVCNGIVIGLTLPAAMWCINLWWSGRQVEQELARIRAAGEPVVWDDLGPTHHEGAGHLYAAAFNLLALEAERLAALEPSVEDWMQQQANQSAEDFLRAWNNPDEVPQEPSNDAWSLLKRLREAQQNNATITDTDAAIIDEMLEHNEQALRLLHDAAAMPTCRFIVIFNMSSDPRMPLLREARQALYLLLLEAGHREAAGNLNGAVDSMIAAARLARIGRDQPVVSVHYVGRSAEAAAAEAAAGMLSRFSLPTEALARLQAILAEPDDEEMFRQSVLAERLILYYYLDKLSHKAHDPESPSMMTEPAARRLVRDAMRDRAKVVALSQQPWPVPLAVRNLEPENEMCGLGLSSRSMWLEAHWMSKIRATITALAIERYRREHDGVLPPSLEALAPQFLAAVPLDPMTGEPLRLIHGEATYTIYGMGQNRKDDGGEVRKRSPEHGDAAALDWGVEVKTGGR